MSKRIENDGGAYQFYHREAGYEIQEIEEELDQRQFISYNKVERGIQGISLGDGTYLHEGEPEHTDVISLDPNVELPGKVVASDRQRSRMETAMVTEDMERQADKLDETIIGGTIEFDNLSGKSELHVKYANGKSKVIKKANFDIANWFLNESVKGFLD